MPDTTLPTTSARTELQAAGMRHDILASLAAVEAAAHALGDSTARRAIVAAIAKEIGAVRDLLTPQPVALRPVDLEVSVRPIVTGARSRGARLECSIPPGTMVRAHPTHLHRIVRNIVDNAMSHAPGARISISADVHRTRVQLRIEDDGPGIPESEREAIFAPWHRGRYRQNRRSTDLGHSGLGLAVCSQLADEMDADVWVEPRPGGGSAFVLTLPIAHVFGL